MSKWSGGAMGKAAQSPENGEVAQDSQPATRQRPEEILARTLPVPAPADPNEWSNRGRRLFFVGLAVAGLLLVVTGLVLTGQLTPGTGNPQPLVTGRDINGQLPQLLAPAGAVAPATS